MNKGVFWPILGVGLAVAVVVVLDRSLHKMEHGMTEASAHAAQLAKQERAKREARQRADLRARTLAPDQQCVSGTVVTVRANYANQVLKGGQPVRCKGRLAETPLR